jgi:hypothetical protein
VCIEHVYGLNALFNVDITGALGTPFFWATIPGIWNKYRVDRARFMVRFWDPSADGVMCGVQLRGPSVSGATFNTVSTRPGNLVNEISNTGEQSATFRGDIDLARAFGQTKAIYHANYGALVSANPGLSSPDYTCMLRLFAATTAGAGTTISWTITIEFDVDLFDMLQ